MAYFATVWKAADNVVYSKLDAVSTAKTRPEHNFDPSSVGDLKVSATADLTVGDPSLAAHALKAALVDECHLFIRPILVGRGKPALPRDTRAELELLDVTDSAKVSCTSNRRPACKDDQRFCRAVQRKTTRRPLAGTASRPAPAFMSVSTTALCSSGVTNGAPRLKVFRRRPVSV